MSDKPNDIPAALEALRQAEEATKRADELEQAELDQIVNGYFRWLAKKKARETLPGG